MNAQEQMQELHNRALCVACAHTSTQHGNGTGPCDLCACPTFHPDKVTLRDALHIWSQFNDPTPTKAPTTPTSDICQRLDDKLLELESRSQCIHCSHMGTSHYMAIRHCHECECTHYHPDAAALAESETIIEATLVEIRVTDRGMQN